MIFVIFHDSLIEMEFLPCFALELVIANLDTHSTTTKIVDFSPTIFDMMFKVNVMIMMYCRVECSDSSGIREKSQLDTTK